MQSYSLTESQKSLLKWMVQEVGNKKLDEEEIWIVWNLDGAGIVGYEGNVPEIKTTTLDALQENGCLVCDRSRNYQYKCALTNRAYEAVNSNFGNMNKVKILFLAADPSDAARLRLGQESRDIREKLQLAKKRDTFVLETRESVRPGDITQAIHDVVPRIVHFSGHGTNTGELCFENSLGKAQPVTPDTLAALFELVAEEVSCVVLNACYSEAQAKAISKHIPFVIGMNKAIGDKAAISFAVGFYKALGAGHSFDKAFKFAQVEIQLDGIPEHLTPVLYTREKIFAIDVHQKNQQEPLEFRNQTKEQVFVVEQKLLRLKELLVAQNWREADRETANLIGGSISPKIREFPVETLEKIDECWKHLSNDRFGFSAQRRALDHAFSGSKVTPETCLNEYKMARNEEEYSDRLVERKQRFAELIGWYVQGRWVADFDYSNNVIRTKPEGYLPVFGTYPQNLFQPYVLDNSRIVPSLWILLLHLKSW